MPSLQTRKHKMTSLLRNLSERIIPTTTSLTATTPGPDGFLSAKAPDALFTRTSPAVDGDACLHDCDSCTISLPRKWSIDEEDKLYGHVQGWSRHLLVATGKSDWVRDVADEKASVMEAVGKHDKLVEGGKLMLSASNIPVPDYEGEREGKAGEYGKDRPTSVLLLPLFKWVDGVTPNLVPELLRGVVNAAPTNTSPFPTHGESNGTYTHPPPSLPPTLPLRSCPHKYLILLCSQATRDARCGQSAPLLRKELERHLRPLNLYRDLHDERPGGVGIYFISHVGGHKYSANMMVYRRGTGGRSGEELMQGKGQEGEASQCIWLARVRPEDCENVVRFTVLQGKVVKPERQLRGGFDREKGVVSW